MNTRLAQLVSQATDVDGILDREKLYELLKLTPEDPTSIVIEAFLATENSRKLLKNDFAEEHEASEAALRRVAEDISDIAAEHSDHLAKTAAELRTAREAGQKQTAAQLAGISDLSDKLAAASGTFRAAAARLNHWVAALLFIIGLLAGAALALAAVYLRR